MLIDVDRELRINFKKKKKKNDSTVLEKNQTNRKSKVDL